MMHARIPKPRLGHAAPPTPSTLGRQTAAPPPAPPTRVAHRFSDISLRPTGVVGAGTHAAGAVVQRAIGKRQRKTQYGKAPYRKSSKFRFIRWRRRKLTGYATKSKAGINLFTVKYKRGGKSYYLTTRSVPATNSSNFKLKHGHSENRFALLRAKFENKHKLKPQDLQWGATEREPCGEGPGMANCRHTLSGLGIPKSKVFYGHEYADREDMRSAPGEKASDLNKKASTHRKHHNSQMEVDVSSLMKGYESDDASEDEGDVVDEYEEDYGEKKPKHRKRASKKLAGAFRGGF